MSSKIINFQDFCNIRMDNAPVKRTELHCHTRMSRMDAVSDLADLTRNAIRWGWKSIAITDHGNVQAFPYSVSKYFRWKLGEELPEDFKFIYGLEGYLVDDLQEKNAEKPDAETVKKMHPYHVILLVQNDTGLKNLYRLVSKSYLQYFHRVPKIPKSELIRHREGLIVGSACDKGELFRALLKGSKESDVMEIARFYDYLEIQPLVNLGNLITGDPDSDSWIHTRNDLVEISRSIISLGEKLGIPVCATGDVHFTEPEDELCRSVLIDAQKDDKYWQPPLFLHTTDEMMEEFEYLDRDKAYEIVVTNPNRIADRIEKISPLRPDRCYPKLDGSDQNLREICYTKARMIYGDELPEPVKERLDTELDLIISHGFSDLYIIAQKMVWQANKDGYVVGSRGSVGSSFVAYLAGITDVNPLPPHYTCPFCHYSDFDSEIVRTSTVKGLCGIDMPDSDCPVCGKPLEKYGFNIPYQTFMGLYGDREPDIDLNFAGEYQSRAREYTEEIFGKGHTFRAGTISTLSENTAFRLAKEYFSKRNIGKSNNDIERIADGCTGVLRNMGIHPGGIVVLPHGEEIDTFTPVQHYPEDDEYGPVMTHFEYHQIDHNLLKLDVLGHDDPTMIRHLQDLTGIDPGTIPMDDPKVMSLLRDTSALGIDTKPANFSDLVKISGLSHGTGVWNDNADELISSGKATLAECISCRDDIMIYLLNKGIGEELSFKIMESLRKGKGLKPEMEQAMREAGVPDWYIDSCKKIQYLFPKAHAASYVMMAWRIAWYRVHYPLEYYSAFFSIRARTFTYEKCCRGPEYLKEQMAEIKNNENPTATESDELRVMKLVLEMYEMGFEFTPIDLYQADAKYCRIINGKIMPHLSSVTGIGEKMAGDILDNLHSSQEKGPFLSKEDFCARSKASGKVADKLMELGILENLPDREVYL